MSLTETPPEIEVEEKQESGATPKPEKRSLPRFGQVLTGLLGLLLVVSLAGLGFWGMQNGNTGEQTFDLKGSPTPASTIASTNAASSSSKNTDLPQVYRLVADPADYKMLYAATSSGLRSSSDGGQTWAEVEIAEIKGQAITALAIDGEDQERPLYVGTFGRGLFKSVDGGKSWFSLGLKNRNLTALASQKGAVYAVTSSPFAGVYHSSDAGKTFLPSDAGNLPPEVDIRSLALDLENPLNVYIGTALVAGSRSTDYSRVKVSRDGGRTWNSLGRWDLNNPNGPDPRQPISVLLYARGDRVYAGDSNRLFRLSPDRGDWQPAGNGLPGGVYALASDPQIPGLVYAATNQSFYRNNGSQDWQKLGEGKAGSLFSTAFKTSPVLIPVNTRSVANAVNGLSTTYLYTLDSEGRFIGYENRDFDKTVVAAAPGFKEPDFTPYGGVNPTAPLEPPLAEAPSEPNRRYFPETKHYLYGGFKLYWEKNGSITAFGYPITEEFVEFIPHLAIARTVQYFERVRLEFDAAGKNGPEVTIGLLGRDAVALKYYVPGRYLPNTKDQAYFPETRHTLRLGFYQFWRGRNNDGLARYGFPLSEELEERNVFDNKPGTVQYFERVKLEFDKEAKEVKVGNLGREVLFRRGWLK